MCGEPRGREVNQGTEDERRSSGAGRGRAAADSHSFYGPRRAGGVTCGQEPWLALTQVLARPLAAPPAPEAFGGSSQASGRNAPLQTQQTTGAPELLLVWVPRNDFSRRGYSLRVLRTCVQS